MAGDRAFGGLAGRAAILRRRTPRVPSRKTIMPTTVPRSLPFVLAVVCAVAAPSAMAAEKPPKEAPLLLLEDFERAERS